MSEQNLEAKLISLEALITEREAFFKSSIRTHMPFGKVKEIYMKTKLLKFTHARLLKKFNLEKNNNLLSFQKNKTTDITKNLDD